MSNVAIAVKDIDNRVEVLTRQRNGLVGQRAGVNKGLRDRRAADSLGKDPFPPVEEKLLREQKAELDQQVGSVEERINALEAVRPEAGLQENRGKLEATQEALKSIKGQAEISLVAADQAYQSESAISSYSSHP